MQRFGRKAVYIVIGDGVEEEQGAKKVLLPPLGFGALSATSSTSRSPPPQALSSVPNHLQSQKHLE